MATPLPPTVHGPITPLSPSVRVTGILAGAQVRVLMDGAVLGELPSASINGEVHVPITGPVPIPKRKVVAIQVLGGVPSEPSQLQSQVEVSEVPTPLPTPVILSQLNTCMTDVWLDALVPGATVIGQVNGAPFGNSKAGATAALLGAPITVSIPSNGQLKIWQEANLSGAPQASAAVFSLPIPQFVPPGGHRQPLPPPKLKEPLYGCDTSRVVIEAVPGAVSLLTQENGSWETFFNPTGSFSVHGGLPLIAGKLTVKQEMKRCQIEGTEAVILVQPMPAPSPPIVSHEICPNVLRITVSNLVAGGEIVVFHERKTGTQVTRTEVGRAGISKDVETFDLPASLDLTDPWADQWLVVTQSRCGSASAPSNPVKPSSATSSPPPKIVEPIFDCARHVRIEGARPGAHLHLFEAGTGYPLSDPYQATSGSMVLKLWFPAQAGKKICLHQGGCGADWNTDPPATVKSLPDPLPRPEIIEPVRPEAPHVQLKGVLPGAMVHLLVNDVIRTSVESLVEDPLIGVPPPALAERQTVFAVQTLCSKTSPREGRAAVVQRGHLKLSVTPEKMMRGTASTLRVDAVDADTGAAVIAQVFLNGTHVGMSGQNISYTPTPAEPNPAGVVRAPGYFDANFSISLNAAAWKLEAALGSGRSDIGEVPIYVDSVHWSITPAWNTALGTTLTLPGPRNYAPIVGSTVLPGPFPSDTNKTVGVTITVTCSSPGGTYNGWQFEPLSGQVLTLSRVVAYDGIGKRISFAFSRFYNETEPDSGEYGGDIGFMGIVNI